MGLRLNGLRCAVLTLVAAANVTAAVAHAVAQTKAARSVPMAQHATPGEARAIQAFDAARTGKASALDLEAFLRRMPKGGELHMHLSGAVYAETFLKDGVADHLCIDPRALAFAPRPSAQAICPSGDLDASAPFHDQHLYDELVDSFSMRGFVPSEGITGHDQFFATFGRFGPIAPSHMGEWLDEVATRAASQNEQYLEIMVTPSFADLKPLWTRLGWPATPPGAAVDPLGDTTGTSPAELSALRERLLAGGLRDEVNKDVQEIAEAVDGRNRMEHCGQPNAAPACSVTIRFLFQVLRANPPAQVFAQTLLGFEVAEEDRAEVRGINFVQPEDAYLAMSEYNRQMHMLDYLHSVYPQVHISLHAGELAPGLVPPAGLRFHIREAVEVGHAERIGHGVDVMYENDPGNLLKEMAERHVSVEINLTSNAVILGVVPPYHPLPDYVAAGVPVSLSTDDEGVSRIDLTHEFVTAAMEYGLGYLELKKMARASIEHSFLAGDTLWADPDHFSRMKPACAAANPAAAVPPADCLALLKSSEKAAQEWELERRFLAFEAGLR